MRIRIIIAKIKTWFIRTMGNPTVDEWIVISGPVSEGVDAKVCPGNLTRCQWVKNRSNTAKRLCSKCGAEDWVMSNPYPSIGEPAYYWKRMHDPNWDKLLS